MSEYTSLEKSKQLAALGFRAEHENVWWNMGNDAFCGPVARHKQEFGPRDTRLICPAYRADTLLEWLVAKDWDIQIGRPHDKVLVDAASMKLNRGLAVEGDTIPDVLADIVFAIIAPQPKEVKSE